MAIKGTILGDIIGSQYEFKRPKDFDYRTAELLTDKCRFTDDTVLTIATKYAIDNGISYREAYHLFGNKYLNVGYGEKFMDWLDSEDKKPYGSYGNGSAMRVSPIVDYLANLPKSVFIFQKKFDRELLYQSKISANCTHNSDEGIKGSQTVAMLIAMAKFGMSKEELLQYGINKYPKDKYAYSPAYTLDEISSCYCWNATCQGSVPAVIRCIYEANSYTEFIRNVFKLKCDTDTLCAIGGGIAEELFDNENDEILSAADEILQKYLDDYLLNVLNNSYGG